MIGHFFKGQKATKNAGESGFYVILSPKLHKLYGLSQPILTVGLIGLGFTGCGILQSWQEPWNHLASLSHEGQPVHSPHKGKGEKDMKKLENLHSPAGELEMQKKTLNGFQGCHENALNESCEMSPHLISLG